MTSTALRWISVAVMLAGLLLLTFAHIGPWANVEGGNAAYFIPVGFFTVLFGVIGLSWGWFLKQR